MDENEITPILIKPVHAFRSEQEIAKAAIVEKARLRQERGWQVDAADVPLSANSLMASPVESMAIGSAAMSLPFSQSTISVR
jgi:hypothetical protein